MTEPALLEGRNLSLSFGSGARSVIAVRQVDLVLNRGEAVGIVGESGSGKSSLGRLLAGLETPHEGSVKWAGRPPTRRRWSKARISRVDRWRVQMVFQDPYGSLDPQQSALDAVAEAVIVWRSGATRADARDEAATLLERMGISAGQSNRLPRGLSGGQRQRVSIARALAPNPIALIADEPTSSIDQSAQAGVLSLFDEIRESTGMGIVLISHDLRVVRNFTDRVYVMRHGQVVESGSTEELFSHPSDGYTKLLLASVPGGWDSSTASTELSADQV